MPGGLHAPISVLLTWRPNYVDPEMRGMKFICFVAAMLSTTYFVVGLRLWARFRLGNNPGLDDLLIMFNLVGLVAVSCDNITYANGAVTTDWSVNITISW